MQNVLMKCIPLVLLVLVGAWGGWINRVVKKFRRLDPPFWPFAENPGLALELADSPGFVDRLLGATGTAIGEGNRQIGRRIQKLDFVFIPLYTAFFIAAAVTIRRSLWVIPAIVFALLTAAADFLEDARILKALSSPGGRFPKPAGQMKWFFYFLTVGSEGLLFFANLKASERALTGALLGTLLIADAIGGCISATKGSFTGISSATKTSALLLLTLAIALVAASLNWPWRSIAEYAVLLRVPVLVALVLMALPFIAFLTPARSLLRGLFDLTPPSIFVVALAVELAAGAACMTAYIVLADAHLRVANLIRVPMLETWKWLLIMLLLGLSMVGASLLLSIRERKHAIRYITAAFLGTGLTLLLAGIVSTYGRQFAASIPADRLQSFLSGTTLFDGYVKGGGTEDPWPDHAGATIAFACALALYIAVGVYGRSRIGKSRTVPALCSALMLLMMLTWILAAATFFFDAWRVPLLLIVGVAGLITAQSAGSDHYYDLRPRDGARASSPQQIINATGSECIIVAAANGGGIQAGAWAAQVLWGLRTSCGEKFDKALRLISSVSGGSVGTAFYVGFLANPQNAVAPDIAAAASSLDEVAWGLAWPDFRSALLPWIFRKRMGRGRCLEKAWCLNGGGPGSNALDAHLSTWNAGSASGKFPAVVLNATISETGERLILGTTSLNTAGAPGKACVDAADLHTINRTACDVGIATAARLSASFPYVTPASRAHAPGPQPHIVDGGYYDNYGMATLVEWLDEALSQPNRKIKKVLVLQIFGAPIADDLTAKRHSKQRGWFYQALAPITTLTAVRTAGQVAHKDIELELLEQKWSSSGVKIETVKFEFDNPNAPLSWHLTPKEVDTIRLAWKNKMTDCIQRVEKFLNEC